MIEVLVFIVGIAVGISVTHLSYRGAIESLKTDLLAAGYKLRNLQTTVKNKD